MVSNRIDDVVRGNVAVGHLVGIEPDAHAVIALAQVVDVSDAVDSQQIVFDINRGIVAQIQVVVAAVGRNQVHRQQNARRLLVGVDALQLHLLRQLRHGQRDAILHEHLRHVQIGAQCEGDRERVRAVIGALRRHVHGAFDAVHLLLDWRRHAVGHHLRIRAG